jgi:hypothetical protein
LVDYCKTRENFWKTKRRFALISLKISLFLLEVAGNPQIFQKKYSNNFFKIFQVSKSANTNHVLAPVPVLHRQTPIVSQNPAQVKRTEVSSRKTLKYFLKKSKKRREFLAIQFKK